MKKLNIYILLIVGISCGCGKEQTDSNSKFLWTLNINNNSNFDDNELRIFDEIPIFNDIVVLPYEDGSKAGFLGFNIITQKTEWYRELDERSINMYDTHIYDGWLCIPDYKGKMIFLNIRNGEIMEGKNKEQYYSASTFGFSNYFANIIIKTPLEVISLFNFNTKIETKIEIESKRAWLSAYQKDYASIDNIAFFLCRNTQKHYDTCMLIEYADNVGAREWDLIVSLYNITKSKWIYNYSKVFSKEAVTTFMEQGDAPKNYYYSLFESYLVKIDIQTGRKIWESIAMIGEYPHRMLVAKDKVYVSRSSGNMFVFDANNGNKLFEIESHGRNSTIKELNGVIYFVSRDYRLRAADAETGKTLAVVESINARPFDLMATTIGVVAGKNGEKGKIIVHDYKTAYCYEALR